MYGVKRSGLWFPALLSMWVFSGAYRILHAGSVDPLVDGARREGEVVLYASVNIAEAKTTLDQFEKRYPFVKVELNRSGGRQTGHVFL